jgi:hypothetical protein
MRLRDPSMKTMKHLRRVLGTFGTLTGLLAFGGLLRAQEPTNEGPEEDQEIPEIVIPGLNGYDDAEQEMIQLFHEVERTLASIDVELYDASAGRIPVPEGKESGIERLLQSHGAKSDKVVSDMERILELAAKMGGSCSRPGGSGQPKPTGESPLDKERQHGPTQSEKTPEGPQPKEGQEHEQPQPQGEKPDDGGQNPPPGDNRPSTPRVDQAGPAVPHGEDADRWGQLPERVRRVFQNQITDDMPLQYRTWIDSYYRRLNQVRQVR